MIFISYASPTRGQAESLAALLRDRGYRSLFAYSDDHDGLMPGSHWSDGLYERMRRSRVVVVVFGRDWLASHWCFAELILAEVMGKTVLPLRIDDCPLPAVLDDHQAIDLIPTDVSSDSPEMDQLVRGLTAAGVHRVEAGDGDLDRKSPYLGLSPYGGRDASLFFGRDDEVSALLAMLNRLRSLDRIGLLLGPSGSGKSSLLAAGLAPVLRCDPGRWFVAGPFRPRDDPFGELAAAVASAAAETGCPIDADELQQMLERWAPGTEHPLVRVAKSVRRASSSERRMVLLLDQVEEVLAVAPADDPASAAFGRLLAGAAGGRSLDGPVVVAALRSDLLPAFQAYVGAWDLASEQVLIQPLGRDRLRGVIEGPARRFGIGLDEELVTTLLDDTRHPLALPLLGYVLEQMVDGESCAVDGGAVTLTVGSYRRIGGIAGCVSRMADDAVDVLLGQGVELAAIRGLLVELARPGPRPGDWLRRPLRASGSGQVERRVLQAFVERRLVVVDGDEQGSRVYEAAHEALLSEWPVLADWLAAHGDGLRWRDEVERAAEQWHAMGRPDAALWVGGALARAVEVERSPAISLQPPAVQFVQASERRQNRRRSRAVRRAWAVAGAFAALMVVASGLAVVARGEARQVAEREAVTAALALAAGSDATRDQNPALALALAAEGYRLTPTPLVEVRSALTAARAALSERRLQPVGEPIRGHEGWVRGVAYSPDGTRVASAGQDGTILLWDPATGSAVGTPLRGHDGPVRGVAFSPDGSLLASAGEDGTVRWWRVGPGSVADPVSTGHSGWVRDVEFSPDGTVLASAGQDGTVRLWDVGSGAALGPPIVAQDDGRWLQAVVFSPDGTMVAAAGDDGKVRLVDLATRTLVGAPLVAAATEPVRDLAFAFGGRRLVTVGFDGAVRTWSLPDGVLVAEQKSAMGGHVGPVRTVAVSGDGALVATGGDDGTVRLWEADTGAAVGDVFSDHDGAIQDLAFAADGSQLATAGNDGTIRLWDPRPAPAAAVVIAAGGDPGGWVRQLAFEPDGRVVSTVGQDGRVHLWDLAAGLPLATSATGHAGSIWSVAAGQRGDLLVTGGFDGTVRLWDQAGATALGVLATGEEPVGAVAVSATGLVAAGTFDGHIRLWDPAAGPVAVRSWTGHAGPVRDLAFSPDGATLVSAGQDGLVGRWQVATGGPAGDPLTGHIGSVRAVAFSPDGRVILTAGEDGTVRRWRSSTGAAVGEPWRGHDGPITSLSVDPADDLVATAGEDGTVRLWEGATGQPVGAPLRSHTGWVWDVGFSPDGSTLVSVGVDGSVRQWDRSLWSPDAVCDLVSVDLHRAQVDRRMPPGLTPGACLYD